MHRSRAAALIVALAVMTVLSGCGRGQEEVATPAPIRTPVPTFTPTAPSAAPAQSSGAVPQAAQSPSPAEALQSDAQPAAPVESAPQAAAEPAFEQPGFGGPVDAAAVAAKAVIDPPLGVVNTELVNSRTGPDITFPVVMVLGRGEEYDITGKSADGAWWRICCVQGKEAWTKAEYVDTDGLTDSLPVAQAGEISSVALARITATAEAANPVQEAQQAQAAQQAAVPAATPAPAAPAATVAPAPQEAAPPAPEVAAANAAPAFSLTAQERFPETNVVRVFLYVYQENEALEGYSLRVTRDGVEQAVSGASFGGRPGMTWPIADDRQRFQNYKVEFPGVAAAGTWTVELTQGGTVVGPAATFVLEAGDTNTEMYVRYTRQ